MKYFTSEQHELRRYDRSLRSYFDISVQNQYSLSFLDIGQSLIVGLGLMAAMLVSAKQISDGTMTTGALVAINAYIIQLYLPLSWLGTSYRMIVNSFTDLDKLFELLDTPGTSSSHY